MTEARGKPKNTAMRRYAGGAKRGFELNHRTQPQISEGIGKMYPAKPMRVKKTPTRFIPRLPKRRVEKLAGQRLTYGQLLIGALTAEVEYPWQMGKMGSRLLTLRPDLGIIEIRATPPDSTIPVISNRGEYLLRRSLVMCLHCHVRETVHL